MDDEMELLLGVRALNRIGAIQLYYVSLNDLVIFGPTTRVRWFKNDGELALAAHDVTICEDGIIF